MLIEVSLRELLSGPTCGRFPPRTGCTLIVHSGTLQGYEQVHFFFQPFFMSLMMQSCGPQRPQVLSRLRRHPPRQIPRRIGPGCCGPFLHSWNGTCQLRIWATVSNHLAQLSHGGRSLPSCFAVSASGCISQIKNCSSSWQQFCGRRTSVRSLTNMEFQWYLRPTISLTKALLCAWPFLSCLFYIIHHHSQRPCALRVYHHAAVPRGAGYSGSNSCRDVTIH